MAGLAGKILLNKKCWGLANWFLFSVEIKSKSSKNCFGNGAEKSVRDPLGGRSSLFGAQHNRIMSLSVCAPKSGPYAGTSERCCFVLVHTRNSILDVIIENQYIFIRKISLQWICIFFWRTPGQPEVEVMTKKLNSAGSQHSFHFSSKHMLGYTA